VGGKKIINDSITYEKLEKVIEDVLYKFFDPDYGLEMRKEFKKVLEKSLKEKESQNIYTIEEVKKSIGYV